MKRSIVYTIVSVTDLILFAVCVAFLPARVSVHYAGGIADRFASPWVFLAFPAATALLSFAVFAAELRARPERRVYLMLAVFAAGAALAATGWVFLALAAQGAAYGEAVYMLPWTISTLVLASAGMLAGYFMHETKAPRLSACGTDVFAASLAGFVVSAGIAFGAAAFDWVGFLLFALMLAAAIPRAWLRK